MKDALRKGITVQRRKKCTGLLVFVTTLYVLVGCSGSRKDSQPDSSTRSGDRDAAGDASSHPADASLVDATRHGIEGEASNADAGPVVLGHPDPSKTYPTYPGFTLYLVEEFSTPLDLDHDPIWTWGDGAISNSQTRFVEDNIAFVDGKMQLSVTQDLAPASYSYSRGDTAPDRNLKSAEVRSRFNMFRWGRYEVALKAPDVDGNFILSMFTFRTPGQQEWREIDFEAFANLPNSINTNIIMADGTSSWTPTMEEPTTMYPFGGGLAQALPPSFENRQEFHVYAFELLPDKVTWFVDGAPIRVKQAGVGANALPVPERAMKIMFNLWVFVRIGLGGDPAGNTYPFSGEYDWFRFYKWDGDDRYPCAPVPGCLDADDLDLSANNPNEMP